MTITLIKHPLTDEERKANQKALAKHLLDRKKQAQAEIREDAKNPLFLVKLEELRNLKSLLV